MLGEYLGAPCVPLDISETVGPIGEAHLVAAAVTELDGRTKDTVVDVTTAGLTVPEDDVTLSPCN